MKEVVEKASWPGDRFQSKFDEAETARRLDLLGLKRDARIKLWYDPEELTFNVSTVKDEDSDYCYWIFIMPKDEDSPQSDDLRDGHLKEVPDYFDSNLMENTWALKKDADRDQVVADMIARGYTHDPSIEFYH